MRPTTSAAARSARTSRSCRKSARCWTTWRTNYPFDPVLIAAFEAQPPSLSPMQALREALHATYTAMSRDDMAEQWERGILILSIPDVRMRMLNDFLDTAQLLAGLVAKRVGRRPDDLAVRTFVGGVIGALMGQERFGLRATASAMM